MSDVVAAAPVGAVPRRREPLLLLIVGLVALAISRVGAYEPGTWVMEVFPIFLALPVLMATYRRFPLTPLAYRLILLHAVVLMVGGHYTYARVPLGFWVQHALDLGRNHYDRLGHLVQGFVPALLAREVFLRLRVVRGRGWLFFLVTCFALALSACYELVEWAAAEIGGSKADAFLGTQGDVWDTQWDMLCALLGALLAQLTLAWAQDRQISRLEEGTSAPPAARTTEAR